MQEHHLYLSQFKIVDPPFSYSQQQGLAHLADLHFRALNQSEKECAHLKQRMERVCCKPDKISSRQTTVNEQWLQTPKHFGDRTKYYQIFVEEIFGHLYPNASNPPDELIHVTCTGYTSPSGAQKLVLKKGWEQKTQVTHAYHMGCMAALPALRIASGYARLGKQKIDVVHTELCSVHLNPALHSDEQLVAQSLFGDGLVKYTCSIEKPSSPSLRLIHVYEELIPQTDELMKWECEEWGLKMTLHKEIPVKIARTVNGFMERLEEKCGFSLAKAYYAVHPGGPKIIDFVGKKLDLSSQQLATSEKILYKHGNMSSATLPYIWEDMLCDKNIPAGSYIVGMAFGPGLCICGAVLQKE